MTAPAKPSEASLASRIETEGEAQPVAITEAMVRKAAEAIIHAKMPDGDTADGYLPVLDDEERAVWGISTPTYRHDRARDMREDHLRIFATALARAALTAALASVPGKGDNTLETALADFSKKLIASQTEIEPEFAEALYGNRAESYRTFEPGTIRICPMRDGPCPHGLSCQFVGDGYSGYPCKEGWNVRAASPSPSSPEDGR